MSVNARLAPVAEGFAPPFGDGRKSLFIASEVRCGSTFLAESIAYELNHSFGCEFWDLAKEPFAYFGEETTAEQALDTWRSLYLDASGFVAGKMMCKALSVLHRLAKASATVRDAFFGENAHWIVLRRRDRVEQAVSLALAKKTKTFHFYGDPGRAPDRQATLTADEIDAAFKEVALSDVYLEVFAHSSPTARKIALEYHDFLDNQAYCLNRVHRLCGFPALYAPTYVNASKIKRTAGEVKRSASEDFKSWFLENHV